MHCMQQHVLFLVYLDSSERRVSISPRWGVGFYRLHTAGPGYPDSVHRCLRPPRLNLIQVFALFVAAVLLLLPWKLGQFGRTNNGCRHPNRLHLSLLQRTPSPISNKFWFSRKFVWNDLILIAIWTKSLQPHSCQRGFAKVLRSGWAVVVAEDSMFTPLVWIMSVMYNILVSVYLEHWEISLIVGKFICVNFPIIK